MSEPRDCPRLPEVLAYLEGEADETAGREARRHLDACPRCRAEAQEWRALSALLAAGDPLADAPPARPEAARRELLARCARPLPGASAVRTPSGWLPGLQPRRPLVWAAAAFLLFMLAAALSLGRLRHPGTPEVVRTPPPAPVPPRTVHEPGPPERHIEGPAPAPRPRKRPEPKRVAASAPLRVPETSQKADISGHFRTSAAPPAPPAHRPVERLIIDAGPGLRSEPRPAVETVTIVATGDPSQAGSTVAVLHHLEGSE